MKIFFFITKSEQGGAQTHVAQLTKFLIEQKNEVTVMSAPGRWLEQVTKNAGATFIANPALGNTANPVRVIRAAWTFLRAVKITKPDVVACHSTIAGLLGRFTLRNRIPTLFTAHGWSFTDGAKLYRRIILPTIERMAARFCSKIICVSQNDLRLAKKFKIAQEKKMTMIYNGMGIASLALRLPRNDGMVEILFIGRLAAPKDPLLLLQALPDRCHLTIIGDGLQKKRLIIEIKKQNLNDRVTLTGALPPNEVQTYLTTTDIFVLPTRYEGFPYTILEAMTYRIPIIASDVGGVREAVGDDAGILVPPNDVQALTEALDRLIHDPGLRARMGATGRRKAETQFSLKTMCERIFEVYRSML